MEDLSAKYAEKYWDAANAITGFAAAHNIVFSLACQSLEMGKLLREDKNAIKAAIMAVVFSVLYCIAIGLLARFQLQLLSARLCDSDDGAKLERILKKTTKFRMGVVTLFGLVSIFAVARYFS